MKITAIAVVLLMVLALGAQTVSPFSLLTQNGALTSCQSPAAGFNGVCAVTDGYYVTINGAAYIKIPLTQGAGGVQTFNNRTGNVLPAAGDYSYSQLQGQPTKISCTTSSQSNTGFTASGCTIQ